MCPPKQICGLSLKALALFTLALSPCLTGKADPPPVFDNLTIAPAAGPTAGNSVGASLLVGSNVAINLTDVVFPQLNPITNTSDYVAGETFAIYPRNSDGSVGSALPATSGIPLYSNFTLTNDGALTTVVPTTPVLLAPDTGYWFVVSSPVTPTSWQYTLSTDYNTVDGGGNPTFDGGVLTEPGSAVAYKTSGIDTTYFDSGPQILYIDGDVLAVPEPSTVCLLALAGAGVCFFVRRRAKVVTPA